MTASELLMEWSSQYAQSAEYWREKGDNKWARHMLARHIETRAKARALAKQATAAKP